MSTPEYYEFEQWVRKGVQHLEPREIDAICELYQNEETGKFTFCEECVQEQWEAWQAAIESIASRVR